ncbi:MAG: peptidylprolyl isomerase [Bacillota bacterium]
MIASRGIWGLRTKVFVAVVVLFLLTSTAGCGLGKGQPTGSSERDTARGAAGQTDQLETAQGASGETTGTPSPLEGLGKTTKTERVLMTTEKGNIELELYPELMPLTVANFKKLVSQGFYNGLTFHRIESWVIQGGDPNGNGTGGPGWTIKLETHPKLVNVRGALAMARALHPDSAGSQFYILKADEPSLDGQYAVFGRVSKGMEVVDRIEIGDKMLQVRVLSK